MTKMPPNAMKILSPSLKSAIADRFESYVGGVDRSPLFVRESALIALRQFPDESIDFAMTSPPYWGKREYSTGDLGLEATHTEFIERLVEIFDGLHRVLKPTGSFWLNIGDSYQNKCMLGIPWRLAFRMMDEQGWVLRNTVVWNKVKGGPDNSVDKLRNVHEPVFHFVKQSTGYFYDVDAIRKRPNKAQVVNGAVVSATGVSGVRYKRQIELSSSLSAKEKLAAFSALDAVLDEVRSAQLADFRMIIRGEQRTTHSDAMAVSGRARELNERGFYFLKYHPNGSKPSDVWDIIPEDSQGRLSHFAPYPSDLCKLPLLATCPLDGVALDPFCGTGTTNFVAKLLGRKSVGIDVSQEYLDEAELRCSSFLL